MLRYRAGTYYSCAGLLGLGLGLGLEAKFSGLGLETSGLGLGLEALGLGLETSGLVNIPATVCKNAIARLQAIASNFTCLTLCR